MNTIEVVPSASGAQMPRRSFLQKTLIASIPATLALAGVPMTGAAAVMSSPAMTMSIYVPPSRSRGTASLNVRDYGAVGDGVMDDTAAFQRAIDALPATGGTVNVPDGTYLIDPVKNVRLRSKMHLQLSAAAVLQAKPNSAIRSYVLIADRISDVEVSGGRIIGDRDKHLGTTGEWGHGIYVRGSNRMTVRDIHISKCWGDGMSIGQTTSGAMILSDDIVVANIVSTGNRRQGLSIGGSRNIKVYDSEFSYTKGTAPECGIDIEPDHLGLTTCDTVHIENCWMHNNNKNGMLIYKRVTGVTLRKNIIEYNGGYGIYTVAPVGCWLVLNTIRHNYWGGVLMTVATTRYVFTSNTFRNNNTRLHGVRVGDKPLTAILGEKTGSQGTGAHARWSADCSDIRLNTNYYSN